MPPGFTPLSIVLDGDNAWPELKSKVGTQDLIVARLEAVAALPGGMQSGKPSVMCRVTLPDGRVVLAETSLALFLSAADAFKARHGDPRT